MIILIQVFALPSMRELSDQLIFEMTVAGPSSVGKKTLVV
jgi:hypothetical protein